MTAFGTGQNNNTIAFQNMFNLAACLQDLAADFMTGNARILREGI